MQLDMFEESSRPKRPAPALEAKVKAMTLASQVILPTVSRPFKVIRLSPQEVMIVHDDAFPAALGIG